MLSTIFLKAERHRVLVGFCFGIILVVGGYYGYQVTNQFFFPDHDKEVHVHADFLMYLDGERIDFSAEKYQSSIQQILHPNFHFHGNEDHVIHRHDDGLTLAEFLASLDYTLTENCLTTDADETFCTDEANQLLTFVNGSIKADVMTYIPAEEDQILVYFGNPNDPMIETYLSEITDESCIYSGTCPERGTPPPESCGITCEI